MNKKEMIEFFGFSSSTVDAWDKGKGSKKPENLKWNEQRKLLYEVLASIPASYVEDRAKMINIDINNFKQKEEKQN